MLAKILVVDDEPFVERLILQRFRSQIRNKEYEFAFALNGVQALELLHQDDGFDIILCDINMPDMDGITLLGRLNELDLSLRTVMVSAYGDMKNIRATMNRGAYDFILKPIDFEDLKLTIDKTLKEVGLIREAARAKTLEEQNEQLSQLDALKSRLFTNISHELRTPLTIITGMTDQIQEQPDRWLNRGLVMIKRNSANLLDLVNQILDLRKLEMGKMVARPIHDDIVHFVKYIFESFQSLAEQKDINLQLTTNRDDIWMDYDPEKVLRILSNLISNAVKFTPVGGRIELHLNHLPGDPERLEMVVKDSGIGISAEALPHVFGRFYQVDEQEQSELGTGIGLTIVNEFVQLLEGTIAVESEVGVGTTFTLTFPIRREAKKRADTESGEWPAVSQASAAYFSEAEGPTTTVPALEELPSLLIVEDNLDLIQYLTACLEDRYQLHYARDGQEGIDKAIELIPDIIVSDVMMPVKDGYELCETLKTDRRTSHIPIVLLTAQAGDEARISGLKKGADAYLTKPFNQEELLIRLQKLIELRLQLQEAFRNPEATVPGAEEENEFIQRIVEEVEQHLDDEQFGIHEVCRNLGMSRSQLHRKLKALTGRSTSHFIRSIRLNKSKSILLNSDLNISQVAFEVGFSDPRYFSRTFQQEFGLSPKAFRQQAQT